MLSRIFYLNCRDCHSIFEFHNVNKIIIIKSKTHNTEHLVYRASCKHEKGKLSNLKHIIQSILYTEHLVNTKKGNYFVDFWSLTGDQIVWVIHYGEKPTCIPVRKLSALFGKFRYASDGTVLYFTWYGTVRYGTDI